MTSNGKLAVAEIVKKKERNIQVYHWDKQRNVIQKIKCLDK